MRQVTREIVQSFLSGRPRTIGNSNTDGRTLFLHGNAIARKETDGGLSICSGGWQSRTTKERLNGLPGVSISQKDWTWYLNGKEWDGHWTNLNTWNVPAFGASIEQRIKEDRPVTFPM